MPTKSLFRRLVPDAPPFRRTERDPVSDRVGAPRPGIANLGRELPEQPGLQKPALVSSYAGRIEQLLLAFPTWAMSNPWYAEGYRSLIAALRPGTEFVVVHHDDGRSRKTIEKWFTGAGHALDQVIFVPLPRYIGFTDWAEDGYVALYDEQDDVAYLMEPWTFLRAGDSLIAEAVQEHTNIRAHQAPLVFQGGNCLIGDDVWFMGTDYFADTIDLVTGGDSPVDVPSGTSAKRFVTRMFGDYVDGRRRLELIGTRRPIPLRSVYGSEEDGRYFLEVASEGVGYFQPIFHIDMLMTLVGTNDDGDFEVLVGDPSLADELLGTSSPFALTEVYQGIADDLERKGFVVHRNPLVHWPTEGRRRTLAQLEQMALEPDSDALHLAVGELKAAGAKANDEVTVRSWHHITWNNCLVENIGEGDKHVYMPTFGHGDYEALAPLDDHMEGLWEELGFRVHRLADFNGFAERQGVVHCISKYLRRST